MTFSFTMRPYFFTLIMLLAFYGFSQQRSFTISWNGYTTFYTPQFQYTIPSFEKENLNFSDTKGLNYYASWSVTQAVDENSVKVDNINYTTISKSELKDLPVDLIPKKLKFKLVNATARTKRRAYFEITPIINDHGVFKKINTFTVSYASSNLRHSRMSASRKQQPLQNSVLKSGNWYKFYVDTTGVYKLSKRFLNQLGVNTNNVDPRTIKVYGHGGAMLPMANDVDVPIDPKELAVKFVGEEDGVFNNDDYLLFYAEGPKEYNEESLTHINAYTDKTYYYINISANTGKRIQPASQPTDEPNLELNTFQDYQFYEVDKYNLAKLGRRWFGDRFYIENKREYLFNFPDIVNTEPAKIKIAAAAVSEVSTSMQISLNGNTLTNFSFGPVTKSILGQGRLYIDEATVSGDQLSLTLDYNNNNNPASLAYLDYISIEATRALNFYNQQFRFKNSRSVSTLGVVQYTIAQASRLEEIWDVTDLFNAVGYTNQTQASVFSFKTQGGALRKFQAVSLSDTYEPKRDNSTHVNNQDLKGTIFLDAQQQFKDVDYLIITPEVLLSQAERLARINERQYNLNVKVVTLEAIYAEFSSSNPDITAIRNFVRYVYRNASTNEHKLKYLCLFGDASYDYKDRIENNTNVVPSWHSYDSFSLTDSFVSDDYYGVLDDDEGQMAAADLLDIAIGRILVETPQRAKAVVDKIESYYSEASFGNWRNNFVVISDDVDKEWEAIVQNTTDELADMVTQEKPFVNVKKIHSDAFQQQSSSAGQTYPEVNKAIKDAVEVGALVVNYFGHGGEDGLASERIFSKFDSQNLKNTCKYNCFVTVTCEYTKFDDPNRPTGGEYTFWNPEGGSIALITTTRQIFSLVGVSFNKILNKYLFAFPPHSSVSMAEALRRSKTDESFSGNPQKRLVFFIGDPAMKLAFPKPDIALTKINEKAVSVADPIKALDKVKLEGAVLDAEGAVLTNYNGTLTVTVFDKDIARKTLGNDRVRSNGKLITLDFKTLGEIIFKGQATVTNGQFSVEFVVPRDIAVPVGKGKVSFYAETKNTLEDQAGANFDIQIGGINEGAAEDQIGPTINLYLNDENFVSGGITNESPTLLAKLQDDNGINTSGGIGHDIVAIIDGDEANPFVLNEYYKASVDDYTTGEVTYPLRDLKPGLHTLTLKAWDVYNNSSTSEIQFMVHDKDQELVINNVLNYPNPFVDYTEFWFNHNSSAPLDVSIQIFSVSGRLVKTLNGQTDGGCCNQGLSNLSRGMVWDGRDDFGDKIGKGVYVYKLKVRSPYLNKQVEKIQKLVIL